MLNTSFEKFRDLVLADETMQKELRGLSDRKEFIARVVELSREHGFELSSDDIENEMRLGSRVWTE
jgi:hypothetical protein